MVCKHTTQASLNWHNKTGVKRSLCLQAGLYTTWEEGDLNLKVKQRAEGRVSQGVNDDGREGDRVKRGEKMWLQEAV